MLSPNQELYLCVRSTSPDIEVDSLHSLIITQGPETVLIIDGNTIQDENISAKYVVPEHNGVAVAMLVPAAFWNYGGMSQVSLTGTVYLKLVNSRRLGAVALSFPSSFDANRILRSEAQSFEDDAEEVVVVEDEDGVDKSSFQVSVGLACISQHKMLYGVCGWSTDWCCTVSFVDKFVLCSRGSAVVEVALNL
jgi:hypothetical protein